MAKDYRAPAHTGEKAPPVPAARETTGADEEPGSAYGNAFVASMVDTSTSTASGTAAPAGPGRGAPAAPAAPAAIPPGFDASQKADELHDAFQGWGTSERAVLDVLYTGRADLTRAIETAYDAKYSPSLALSLHSELSGDDLEKALRLLSHGGLTLADKIREGAKGWGTDEDKIFSALERATAAELAAVKADAQVIALLQGELSGDDWQLASAFLAGNGQLAARLRRAVSGWGTDEKAIWRALESASDVERAFVLSQPVLLRQLESDLDASDWERCKRMLRGQLDSVDKIEIAMAGWGTDEGSLHVAIAALTAAEFTRLPVDIDTHIASELSGRDLALAQDALHQKRLEFDAAYRQAYMKKQESALGAEALMHDGASALIAQEGQARSAVARLKAACVGMGTDDTTVWEVLAGLTSAEREFIRKNNPEGVLDALRGDLSGGDYERALASLGGAGSGAVANLKQAVEGWGTDETLIYHSVLRATAEGVGPQVLADPAIMDALRSDLSQERFFLLVNVLNSGRFTSRQRLAWATSGAGTDEDLVFDLCSRYALEWWDGRQVAADVDAVLKSELSTRDYWMALDRVRGAPTSEQDRLARSKEELERERSSGMSAALMDTFSTRGENADDAWREYQGSYNRAYADGEIGQDEAQGLRRDETFSQQSTADYRDTKASAAQWATQIAVAIVGIAATILTAGAAGPFVAGLAAALGGKVAVAAEMMVLAAVAKVGLNRAIQGEGYDLTSAEALIDATASSLEIGLNMVGGAVAKAATESLSKTAMAARVGGSVEKIFGSAGKRILGAGLEGTIDDTVGGIGEGAFTAAADEKTWQGDSEAMAGKFGGTVFQRTAMSAASGFVTRTAFQSLAEVYGAHVRSKLGDDPANYDTPGDGEGLVRRQQTDELPGLREQHAANGYADHEHGEAFVQGKGDEVDIDPNDVKQGALGDCYLMAGMAATARADPDNIRKIIKPNGDGTFEVTIYVRDKSWSAPKPVTKTVDARLPAKGGSSTLYAGIGDKVGDSEELWPALLEKTVAQHKGSYDMISGGNIAKDFEFHGASELFTGKTERYFTAASLGDDQTLKMMNDALTSGKPITVDSMNMEKLPDLTAEANKVNVYGNHAYAVESVDIAKKTINLQNPWGSNHVVDLPIKDFKRFYRAVRVGGG